MIIDLIHVQCNALVVVIIEPKVASFHGPMSMSRGARSKCDRLLPVSPGISVAVIKQTDALERSTNGVVACVQLQPAMRNPVLVESAVARPVSCPGPPGMHNETRRNAYCTCA